MITKDKIFVIGFAILALVALLIAAGCVTQNQRPAGFADSNAVGPLDSCPVTDYGNGVTFVGCNEGAFAAYLSRYIGENDVGITAIAEVPSTAAYNGNYGYIVVAVPRNTTTDHSRLK